MVDRRSIVTMELLRMQKRTWRREASIMPVQQSYVMTTLGCSSIRESTACAARSCRGRGTHPIASAPAGPSPGKWGAPAGHYGACGASSGPFPLSQESLLSAECLHPAPMLAPVTPAYAPQKQSSSWMGAGTPSVHLCPCKGMHMGSTLQVLQAGRPSSRTTHTHLRARKLASVLLFAQQTSPVLNHFHHHLHPCTRHEQEPSARRRQQACVCGILLSALWSPARTTPCTELPKESAADTSPAAHGRPWARSAVRTPTNSQAHLPWCPRARQNRPSPWSQSPAPCWPGSVRRGASKAASRQPHTDWECHGCLLSKGSSMQYWCAPLLMAWADRPAGMLAPSVGMVGAVLSLWCLTVPMCQHATVYQGLAVQQQRTQPHAPHLTALCWHQGSGGWWWWCSPPPAPCCITPGVGNHSMSAWAHQECMAPLAVDEGRLLHT